MSRRFITLSKGEIYHIYNRGVDKRNIFIGSKDYQRFYLTLDYYQYKQTIKFSRYLTLKPMFQEQYRNLFIQNPNYTLFGYVLMPNHFHLLLRPETDKALPATIMKITDSYSKYFNIKRDREGHLFQNQFKAVHIESDEQFLHVLRYMHLNPITANLVHSPGQLHSYLYSSYLEYILNKPGICHTGFALNFFNGNRKAFQTFTEDQANYQKELHLLKQLTFE